MGAEPTTQTYALMLIFPMCAHFLPMMLFAGNLQELGKNNTPS